MTENQVINQFDLFKSINETELLTQIGAMNVMAISGGCRYALYNTRSEVVGLRFPAGAGYWVDVLLAGDDTYTVRRVFIRGGKEFIKGELTGVYCDEIGEVAYVASCYVNRSFGDDLKDGDR
jgi:hypothetical protein